MVGMGMRKHDCSGRDTIEPPEPVHSAINHDPNVEPRNEQRAMTIATFHIVIGLIGL